MLVDVSSIQDSRCLFIAALPTGRAADAGLVSLAGRLAGWKKAEDEDSRRGHVARSTESDEA